MKERTIWDPNPSQIKIPRKLKWNLLLEKVCGRCNLRPNKEAWAVYVMINSILNGTHRSSLRHNFASEESKELPFFWNVESLDDDQYGHADTEQYIILENSF